MTFRNGHSHPIQILLHNCFSSTVDSMLTLIPFVHSLNEFGRFVTSRLFVFLLCIILQIVFCHLLYTFCQWHCTLSRFVVSIAYRSGSIFTWSPSFCCLVFIHFVWFCFIIWFLHIVRWTLSYRPFLKGDGKLYWLIHHSVRVCL